MPNLSKYNTLTEALAFNLTTDEIKEYAYYRTYENRIIKDVNFYHVYKFDLSTTTNNRYYQGALSNFNAEFSDTKIRLQQVSTSCGRLLQTKKHSEYSVFYGREIDITAGLKTSLSYTNDLIVYNNCLMGGIETIYKIRTDSYPIYYGSTIPTTKRINNDTEQYNLMFYVPRYDIMSNFKTSIDSTHKTFLDTFSDFRWYDTKLVWLLSDIYDNTLLNESHNIPDCSIFLFARDADTKTRLEAQLPTLETQCTGTIETFVSLLNIIGNTSVWYPDNFYNSVYIGYVFNGFLYVFQGDSFGLNSLFMRPSESNGGEAYPLTSEGYIDYDAIDYRKTYTNAVGAAKLNPRAIAKLNDMYYTSINHFDPYPTVPDVITLDRQIYNTTYNSGTLTIELGHYVKDDKTIINNELISVTSEKGLINITQTSTDVYTVSFKNTTTDQEDKITVSILQAFLANRDSKGIIKDTYFTVNFIADAQAIYFIKAYPTYLKKLISKHYTNQFSVYYEQFTDIPTADITTMNDNTNLTAAETCMSKYFVLSSKLQYRNNALIGTSDIYTLTSISAGTRGISVTYKGNSYNLISDQNLEGDHKYTFTCVSDTSKSVVVTTNLYVGSGSIIKPVPPKKIILPIKPVPPSNGGGGGGGGSGSDSKEAVIIGEVLPVDEDGYFQFNEYYVVKAMVAVSYGEPYTYPIAGGLAKNFRGGYAWFSDDGKTLYTNDCGMIDVNTYSAYYYAYLKSNDIYTTLPQRIYLGENHWYKPCQSFVIDTWDPNSLSPDGKGNTNCGYTDSTGDPLTGYVPGDAPYNGELSQDGSGYRLGSWGKLTIFVHTGNGEYVNTTKHDYFIGLIEGFDLLYPIRNEDGSLDLTKFREVAKELPKTQTTPSTEQTIALAAEGDSSSDTEIIYVKEAHAIVDGKMGLKIKLKGKWDGFKLLDGYILLQTTFPDKTIYNNGVKTTITELFGFETTTDNVASEAKFYFAVEPITEAEWRAKYYMATEEENILQYLVHTVKEVYAEQLVYEGVVDEQGNPVMEDVLDENGDPIYEDVLDENGDPVIDETTGQTKQQKKQQQKMQVKQQVKIGTDGKEVVDEKGNPVMEDVYEAVPAGYYNLSNASGINYYTIYVNNKTLGPGTYNGRLIFTDVDGNTKTYTNASSTYDGKMVYDNRGYGGINFGNNYTFVNVDSSTGWTKCDMSKIKSFEFWVDTYESIDYEPVVYTRATTV